MLTASPITDKVPEFTKAPLIAVVGACSLGKTATNMMLLNHFSDKVSSLFLILLAPIINLVRNYVFL